MLFQLLCLFSPFHLSFNHHSDEFTTSCMAKLTSQEYLLQHDMCLLLDEDTAGTINSFLIVCFRKQTTKKDVGMGL